MKFHSLGQHALFAFLTVSCLFNTTSFANDCLEPSSAGEVEQNLANDVSKAADKVFDCRATFLASLKSRDPDGFRIWNSLSAESKKQLEDLIACEPDGQVSGTDVATLVHESVHLLDGEKSLKLRTRAYLRTNGKWTTFQESEKGWLYKNSRGQALKTMSLDERQLTRSKTYLYDLGSESFSLLLDELNAYSQGVKTSLRYPKILGSNEREGPLEMMVFSVRYLEAMKKNSPKYYQSLMANHDLVSSVKALFEDAYSVYNQSCDRTDLNMDDMRSIRALQTDSSRAVMKTLFGDHAPAISARCIANAKLAKGGEITPLDYPHMEAVMAKSKKEAATPASSSEAVHAVQIPPSKCDPSKPCATYYFEYQKDGTTKMWGDLKGNHLEWIFSQDGTTKTFWNGKVVSEEEFYKRIVSDPEILALNNNAQTVEKSASPAH